jgi:hypothetical protein
MHNREIHKIEIFFIILQYNTEKMNDYCIDIIEKKYEQVKQPNIYETLYNDSIVKFILSFIIIYVIGFILGVLYLKYYY